MIGVLLILSCQSYYQTTLSKIKINPCFDDIIRVNVIGGYDSNTISYDEKLGYLLKLSCPDDYLYLLEKYCSSLKYIYTLFRNIKGVLRCCDDIDLTEQQIKTIFQQDYNYAGLAICHPKSYGIIFDDFLFISLHRFPKLLEQYPFLSNLFTYSFRPHLPYAGGNCVYLSNHCNNILLDWSKKNSCFSSELIDDSRIFLPEFMNDVQYIPKYMYPYYIDDVAFAYILKQKNIYPTKINVSDKNKTVS